jgi:hypothetical protein
VDEGGGDVDVRSVAGLGKLRVQAPKGGNGSQWRSARCARAGALRANGKVKLSGVTPARNMARKASRRSRWSAARRSRELQR